MIEKNERDAQELKQNQLTSGTAGYSKLSLLPYQEEAPYLTYVPNSPDTDNCWVADYKEMSARFTVGERISKINRIRVLVPSSYSSESGYEFTMCVGRRCNAECEQLRAVEAGHWVESLCAGMPAEYIRISTSIDSHLLSFCQVEVYGQQLE
ncbi:uncharacterized protein LOC142354444 [Convolutriloba macropyga]|uniref:uncharacterized protein LOC142354444 n=1 Tax=Convolutriloba macropyga TaxID=536237 RepID=UPI003F521328